MVIVMKQSVLQTKQLSKSRSSKAALIWCLATGLLLMPRFFVMLVEGIGKALGWTEKMIYNISMIAPGVMMQALSEVSDAPRFTLAAADLQSVSYSFLCLHIWPSSNRMNIIMEIKEELLL
jgi:hypothetical protein